MSELLALGTSHKTAPLALRERIALLDGGAEALVAELTANESVSEAVALSTCNRTELYLVVSDPVEAESFVLGLLARSAGLRPTELVEGMYSLRNCDAARHLYRVTSGLESMIVGEAEVQGQVKRAYELALTARTTGPMTNKLFRAALATGKRVRTETAISAGRASVASVAVDAARGAIGDLAQRHVVIIGAGETAELTANPSVSEAVALSTCNRTELYLVVSDPVEAEAFVLGLLARRAALRPTELVEGIYSLRNCDAARHLYRVASGLCLLYTSPSPRDRS